MVQAHKMVQAHNPFYSEANQGRLGLIPLKGQLGRVSETCLKIN